MPSPAPTDFAALTAFVREKMFVALISDVLDGMGHRG